MTNSKKILQGHLLNWKAISASLILVIISICLLWISSTYQQHSQIWLGNVLPAFASVIATSGVFSLMYEIFIRRQQTDFVLESIELKESIIEAGIVNVYSNYLDFDFSKAIKHSHSIRLFVLYAAVWLNRYTIEIKDYITQENHSLTLCVPSLDNNFIRPLSIQFGYSEEDVRRKISESISLMVRPALKKQLGKGSKLKIYMHSARPSYSMYQFDDVVLVGNYYCSNARRRAPMFVFKDKPGSLFEEFNSDLSQVISDNSQVVYDSEEDINNIVALLGKFTSPPLKELLETG